MTTTIRIALVAFLLLGFALSCSQDETSTSPGAQKVSIQGTVIFPVDSLVDLEGLRVGFGDSEADLDGSGAFSLSGNAGIPGLAMVYGPEETALLMAVVPDPRENVVAVIDARSTALALAFLSPFACTSDPTQAEEVLARLESLPAIDDLEEVLEARIGVDPEALLFDDARIDSALTDVLISYINSFQQYHTSRAAAGLVTGSGISITPDWETGGHRLTHTGGDQYKITNSKGRWAYCLTPEESFYLFPNGTMLDILKGNPWAPSEHAFEMEVPFSDEATEVNVYGLGWAPVESNVWDSLSVIEQDYALNAGMATVLLELIPQMVSVVTNSSTTLGKGQIGKAKIVQLLGYLKHQNTLTRSAQYIREGDPLGLFRFLAETIVNEFVSNEQFRATFLETVGMSLSEGAVKRAAGSLLAPLRVFLTTDAIVNVMKTAMGFQSTYFKTTFEVWNESIEVGNVMGHVYDQGSGGALEGATVVLEGDEGNPLNPTLTVETSASGTYYFGNISKGEKTIRASKEGYGSGSVTVTVVADTTVWASDIILTPVSGTLTGRALDAILVANGVANPLFAKELALEFIPQGGTSDYTRYPHNGTYSLNLAAGTYKIRASAPYYYPDSVTAVVPGSGVVSAPDLVMEPACSLSGSISLDMDNDGSYETAFEVSTTAVGARAYADGPGIEMVALIGSPLTDVIQIIISTERIQAPGVYSLGDPLYLFAAGGPDAAPAYVTARQYCYDPDYGTSSAMVFSINGDPSFQLCNCGITNFGALYVEEPYGTDLTDVVRGALTAYLPGSTTCSCWCCDDVDGDGQEDDWVTGCARARVEVNFVALVGSLDPESALASQRIAGRAID
jgi:hypothetical protein